jgi:chloramphenicol O-acetyltransferase
MGFKFGQKIIDILRFKWYLTYLKRKRLKNMNWFTRCQLMHKQLGRYSHIGDTSQIIDINTVIGKFCSIASFVSIGTGMHPKDFLSSSPFQYAIMDDGKPENNGYIVKMPPSNLVEFTISKPCFIGNDVWIGMHSVIMDGITIVVGANRIIGYRFSPEIIKQLLELKWWDLDEKYLYDLPFNDINECIKKLKVIRESLK